MAPTPIWLSPYKTMAVWRQTEKENSTWWERQIHSRSGKQLQGNLRIASNQKPRGDKEGFSPAGFRGSTALLVPWLETSSLQNWETMHFSCFKQPNLWYFVAVPGKLIQCNIRLDHWLTQFSTLFTCIIYDVSVRVLYNFILYIDLHNHTKMNCKENENTRYKLGKILIIIYFERMCIILLLIGVFHGCLLDSLSWWCYPKWKIPLRNEEKNRYILRGKKPRDFVICRQIFF